jgi:hypothetical protein
MLDPFSDSQMAKLFETDPAKPELLKRRESSWLELKENFNRSRTAMVQYGRTMAAFSNRDGGYLLFGVQDRPHLLRGMTNDNFDQFDPRTLSQFLAEHFAPNIDWQHMVHVFGEGRFGLIYTAPSKRQPIVCTRNNNNLRDGEVYYRYQGETRLIASAELHGLIQNLLDSERKAWRDLLSRTAQTTPSSTYLLDTSTGRASGGSGSFVLSEQLLDRVNFIQEGRFEEGGEPTLRVIGDVEVVRTETVPVPQPVPTNPAVTHPLLQMNLITDLNGEFGEGLVNSHDMLCVRRVFDIDSDQNYFYRNTIGSHSPQYSQQYLEWLKEQYRQNQDFFIDIRQRYKEMRA